MWIADAWLQQQIAMTFTPRDGDPLRCPVCAKTMAPVVLEGVAVERCDGHGVWFDEGELQVAIDHARRAPPVPADTNVMPSRGFWGSFFLGILEML